MAITLAEAKLNTQDDVTFEVIDEFQKQDQVLDALTFDDSVTPGAGGASLHYAWTMLATERPAGPRDWNSENAKGKAVRTRKGADLIPFHAPYEIDRALAHLGPRATDEVALQSSQAIKSVRAAFNDAIINGANQPTDGGAFEGLDALVTGSTTDFSAAAGGGSDWSGVNTEDGAHTAIDGLDEVLSSLDGEPTFILSNRQGILRLRSIARRAGYYSRERDEFGRQVEAYANVPFVDMGAKAGSAEQVIPVSTTDFDGDAAADDSTTFIYVVRLGLDGFHGVSVAGAPLVSSYLPEFRDAKVVHPGDVELGPSSVALKATKAAARLEVKLA